MSKEQVLKELENMVRNHQCVLTDPMNGCPEDFAEDFEPQESRKVAEAFQTGATYKEVTKAIAEGQRKASEDYEKIFGEK
jgi:hypothetical protein